MGCLRKSQGRGNRVEWLHASRLADINLSKAAKLQAFRNFPEKILRTNETEWRYRSLGASPETLLLLPGGELVNDIAFDFALALHSEFRIVYPAYPRLNSVEELADGLGAILEAEGVG